MIPSSRAPIQDDAASMGHRDVRSTLQCSLIWAKTEGKCFKVLLMKRYICFRMFVVVPHGSGFCIVNETLFVTTATPYQIKVTTPWALFASPTP
jgi:hypothetical protein